MLVAAPGISTFSTEVEVKALCWWQSKLGQCLHDGGAGFLHQSASIGLSSAAPHCCKACGWATCFEVAVTTPSSSSAPTANGRRGNPFLHCLLEFPNWVGGGLVGEAVLGLVLVVAVVGVVLD